MGRFTDLFSGVFQSIHQTFDIFVIPCVAAS